MENDISLEPLFNEGKVGRKPGIVPIDTVGVASHRTPITVNSTAQEITITPGNRTIEIFDSGSKIIYYGGAGVTSSNGIRLTPNQLKVFANVKDDFSIYLVSNGTDTSEVRIVEYT